MAVDSDTLVLQQGSTRPAILSLVDDRDQPETLSGVSAAVLEVKDGNEVVLHLDLGSGLTMDSAASTFTLTPSQSQADALPVGVFAGQLALLKATGWEASEVFRVQVSRLRVATGTAVHISRLVVEVVMAAP